jgi:hypothetical protein
MSYHPTGQLASPSNAAKPLMSVPNPKRSVPANILNIAEEDAGDLFADDSYVLGSSRTIRSPIMELNPTRDAAKLTLQPTSTSRTPEIFDILGTSNLGTLPIDQRSVSRGVIGSARKVKSSASVLDDGFNSSEHTAKSGVGSESLLSLLDQPQSSVGAAANDWEAAVRMQLPINRPSSTPIYSSGTSTNFLGGLGTSSGDAQNELTSLSNAAGDLHIGGGSSCPQSVRGRDRDYSFGSLLGLSPRPDGSSPRKFSPDGVHQALGSGVPASDSFGQLQPVQGPSSNSRGSSRASQHVFVDVANDHWLTGASNAGTSREALRNSLALGGTVSAPPLLNMYSYGYNSFNNTSAFGAQQSTAAAAPPASRFDPLAARYDGVLHPAAPSHRELELEKRQDMGARRSPAPYAAAAGSPPPQQPVGQNIQVPYLSAPQQMPQHVPLQQQQYQQQQRVVRPEGGPEGESVEGMVLRSCRDILVGAADHSLKAVELANTLRARGKAELLCVLRDFSAYPCLFGCVVCSRHGSAG